MSELFHAADFEKHLNTKFRVYYTDENYVEAELVEVLELRKQENLESFSIIFLLPDEFGYAQQVFRIEHTEMGTMELFIVPVSQTENGIRYEAIFNYVIKK